jgi:hypothetical protein
VLGSVEDGAQPEPNALGSPTVKPRRAALFVALAFGPFACATAVDDTTTDPPTDPPITVDASKPPSQDASKPPSQDASAPDDATVQDATVQDASAQDASVKDASVQDASVQDASIVKDAAPAPDAAQLDGSSGCPTTSGVLATFDFTGQLGNQVSTPVTSNVQGLTVGAISRGSGLTAVSGKNSINSSGWPGSSSLNLASTSYLTLTVTPDPKCKLDLSSMSVDTQTSPTGPAKAAVSTSADAFKTSTAFTPGNGVSNVTMSVSAATGAVEIRIFGHASVDPSGTMRVQNTFTLSGALK